MDKPIPKRIEQEQKESLSWWHRHITKKDWRHFRVFSGTNVPKMKSIASRKFRRKFDELEDGKNYKKHFCHYDINDFK